MDSSHITGDDGEGCNSSESGWTMYLASHMHGDDDRGGEGCGSEGSNVDDGYGYISGRGSGGRKKHEDDGDGDDDDSLASDASTGPAKAKAPSTPDGDEDGGGGHRKHDDDVGGGGKEEEEEEEDVMHTKLSMRSRKKGSKTEKGEGKPSSRRGHNKTGSS
ncbi:hypothetical protein ABZP36_029695 [Zizania latifolia]